MRLSEGINDTLPSPTLPERRKWKRVFVRKIVTGTRSPVRPVPKNLGVRSVQNYAPTLGWIPTFPSLCIHSPTVNIYVNKRGNKKTIQTIHKPYIQSYISLIFRALRNVGFVLQTIHKLYTNYTLKRSKPYTKGGGKPYTERYMEAFKTLHETERKPCTATARSLLRNAPK